MGEGTINFVDWNGGPTDFDRDGEDLQTGLQFVRRVGKGTVTIGTSDFATQDLDSISAGLHRFKFIVKEFIDVHSWGCFRFNFDLDTPNVSRTTHT